MGCSSRREEAETDLDRARRFYKATDGPGATASVAQVAQAEPADVIDQLRIRKVCFQGGLRKILVGGEHGIRIRFNEIHFVIGIKAKVEPGITVDCQQMI